MNEQETAGKLCPGCARFKAIEEFGVNKRRPDGRTLRCRACVAELARGSYRKRAEAQGREVRERVPLPPGHKRCPTCEEIRPHSEWHKARSNADGLASECKPCRKERGAREHLRRSYGLTPEEVRDMLRSQDGLCAICCAKPAEHIDHDHETGQVREMLCFTCNAMLGMAKDDRRLLRTAAAYLVWHAGGRP